MSCPWRASRRSSCSSGSPSAIGAVINSVGLVINIINHARRRATGRRRCFRRPVSRGRCSSGTCCSSGCASSLGGRLRRLDLAALAVPLLALCFREADRPPGPRPPPRPQGRPVRLRHGRNRRDPRIGDLLRLQLRLVPPRGRLRACAHGAEHHRVPPLRTWWAALRGESRSGSS